ncbi:MAG TPA: PRC-barrel domain-containing protein [Syntrophomonadaceae bacterium]|nr:PRC-barrel domain-containing protein [Syntrophomonadaceae bacterium]
MVYSMHSLDGEIGTVNEFYFDDRHWTIRYLIADTGNWLMGKQVLISPYALAAVNNEEHYISIDLTKRQIEDSPSLDTDITIARGTGSMNWLPMSISAEEIRERSLLYAPMSDWR